MDIYTATIAVSILIYVVVGNYAGRGIKRLDDYFIAGRQAPTLFILEKTGSEYVFAWLARPRQWKTGSEYVFALRKRV